jgi:hypothetical protein
MFLTPDLESPAKTVEISPLHKKWCKLYLLGGVVDCMHVGAMIQESPGLRPQIRISRQKLCMFLLQPRKRKGRIC